MIANSEPLPPLSPRTKLRRYLFLLIVLGVSVYFLLPQVARIEHALLVVHCAFQQQIYLPSLLFLKFLYTWCLHA